MQNIGKLRENGWLDTKAPNSPRKVLLNMKLAVAVEENNDGTCKVLFPSRSCKNTITSFEAVETFLSEMK